jgi:hypothetical protein
MPLHTDSHFLHNTLRALQLPGDAVYKAAILVAAALLLLTALV